MNGGFNQVGSQQSRECSLDAGTLFGVPITISYFLLLFFVGNMMEAAKGNNSKGFAVAYALCSQLVLFLTVLLHEFGHGSMAKYLGGRIMGIFLWPFGGICSSTQPPNEGYRSRIRNDLKVVTAGPATHIPMCAFWLGLVASLTSAFAVENPEKYGLQASQFFWSPFHLPRRPPGLGGVQWLALMVAVNGVTTNVNLFCFNVFFPMYPMDSAKIVVCTLQLCCKCGYRRVARVLVCLSGCAGGLMILRTMYAKYHSQGGGNVNANLPMMLAMMSLVETVRIYQMLQKNEVHRHPLFAGADQEPELETFTRAPAPEPARPLAPLSSSGLLGGSGNREAFLDRVQLRAEEERLTVRELEERGSSRR